MWNLVLVKAFARTLLVVVSQRTNNFDGDTVRSSAARKNLRYNKICDFVDHFTDIKDSIVIVKSQSTLLTCELQQIGSRHKSDLLLH